MRQGSYSPVAQGEWIDINDIFAFKIIFDSSLGEEDRMIDWAMEEFRNLSLHGVEKEWLENAIRQESLVYERGLVSFSYNNFWQNYLQTKTESRKDLEKEVLQYSTVLKHFISLQDINKAAKLYLKEENLQQFVILPELYQSSKGFDSKTP